MTESIPMCIWRSGCSHTKRCKAVGHCTGNNFNRAKDLGLECALIDGVIYCQCGDQASHYGTMGERGAREVRCEAPPREHRPSNSLVLCRCPFCGGTPRWCADDEHECHQVVCDGCKISIDFQENPDTETVRELQLIMAAKWNMRVAIAEIERPAQMGTPLGMLPINSTGMRQLVEALDRASHEPPAEPVGFVPRRKSDGYIARDFAAPGDCHPLTSSFEWVPVYTASSQPPGARPEIVAAAGRISNQVKLHDEDDQFSTDLRMLVAHVAGQCDKCPKERARGCIHCCWCGTALTKASEHG